MPVEQWFEQTEARKILVNNMRCNLVVYVGSIISIKEIESIVRLQLIMIRQCMLDERPRHGVLR